MGKRFLPDRIFRSIYEIPPGEFVKNGIQAVIFDIDDTLVANDVKTPPQALLDYFETLRAAGISYALISNGRKERVQLFNRDLGVFAAHRAFKPRKKPLVRAMRAMGSHKKNTALVGDQLFTDIYGGNRAGLYTILVTPIKPDETRFIKLKRKLETRILKNAGK